MWTFPVLLDSRPSFVSSSGSLLLAPLGRGTVLSHLRARLGMLTRTPPVVVAGFGLDEEYEGRIRAVCPDTEGVETTSSFVERCLSYAPSDRMLLADPRCFPLDPLDPALLALGRDEDPRWVKHLVVLEQGDGGMKERVDTDTEGRVRGIQRYYDSVTWPFVAGIACSLVPNSTLRLAPGLALASLAELRRGLAAEGVPSRDLALERGALNLDGERGMLALNERVVLEIARERGPGDGSRPLIAETGSRVHPSACFVGPVVLQEGSEVEEGATIIGPTVVGPHGRVGAGATVAHSIVGAGRVVEPGRVLRQRALLAEGSGSTVSDPDPERDTVPASPPEGWGVPLSEVFTQPPRRRLYPFVKRAVDVTAAALGLALLSPLGVLVALLVKLESKGKGSIFFPHLREGMGGRPFRCWKFRTMIPGADVLQRRLSQMNKMDGPQFKVDRDPRLTRIGRFLIRTNLDELPQLVNVLLGQMSLVGPRPSPFRENQICVPWREGRLSVRPGMTGLWQVCRHDRDQGDFHQWIYYDLLYVQFMSFRLDVQILVGTFLALSRGGRVPLSWLIQPEKYGERRAAPRRAVPRARIA